MKASELLSKQVHNPPLSRMEVCETHGQFESLCHFSNYWRGCPVCGQEQRDAENAKREAQEREAKIRAWQRFVCDAGIPERFRNRTLDTYVASNDGQRAALAFAQAFADDWENVSTSGRSAIFVGKPGTGKTHLAVGIGLQVMLTDRASVMFTTVMRAIRRVKDTWSKSSNETETEAIAALVFPELLILDEVGVQFGSDAEKLILFDVLNERYEKRRPTILMSNLTKKEVADFLGDRVVDRIREDGGRVIVFDWESHRKGGA